MGVIKNKPAYCKNCGKEVYKYRMCFDCFTEYAKEYQKKYREKNAERLKQYDKDRYNKQGKKFICVECSLEFKSHIKRKFCSRKCQSVNWKRNGTRKGKNNPDYKNGLRTNKKKYPNEHLNACRKYRKVFLEKNDYIYCEECGISNSIRYETHHIVFASEAPKHKELHNPKNLTMVCIKCHNKFHAKKSNRNELVTRRGLEKLFNLKLLR